MSISLGYPDSAYPDRPPHRPAPLDPFNPRPFVATATTASIMAQICHPMYVIITIFDESMRKGWHGTAGCVDLVSLIPVISVLKGVITWLVQRQGVAAGRTNQEQSFKWDWKDSCFGYWIPAWWQTRWFSGRQLPEISSSPELTFGDGTFFVWRIQLLCTFPKLDISFLCYSRWVISAPPWKTRPVLKTQS